MAILTTSTNKEDKEMAKFNAKLVSEFVCSKDYKAFEYQAPTFVANHFGCTKNTAIKWVNRVRDQGMIKVVNNVATLVQPENPMSPLTDQVNQHCKSVGVDKDGIINCHKCPLSIHTACTSAGQWSHEGFKKHRENLNKAVKVFYSQS